MIKMKGKIAIIFFLNNDDWQKPSQLRGPADGWALPHSRYERNSFIQRQSRGLLIRLLFGFIIFKRHISTALLSRGEIQCNMLYPCSFQETFTCAVFHLYLFKRPSLVLFSICIFSGDILRPLFMMEAGWWAGQMVLPIDEEKWVQVMSRFWTISVSLKTFLKANEHSFFSGKTLSGSFQPIMWNVFKWGKLAVKMQKANRKKSIENKN